MVLRRLCGGVQCVRAGDGGQRRRETAGIDGQAVLTGPGKAELARFVQQRGCTWQARPVRRVFIPKNKGPGLLSLTPAAK